MSSRLRVLVVDDAVIVRRLVAQALARDPEIEVAGTASDGDIALTQLAKVPVDIVTLDIDMPHMNGMATLKEIRSRWPELPVVIFTGMPEPGPAELEALALGASDVVQKLPHEGNMLNALEWVQERLAPRLKQVVAACQARPAARPATAPARKPVAAEPAAPEGPIVLRPRPAGRGTRPQVLLVGSSTGGPNALELFFARLPADFPLPMVVVQHMPAGFTRLLAQRLTSRTPFPAAEGEAGAALAPGRIWIAPGDRHLVVRQSGPGVILQTNREPPENSCRPAVDVLFRSAAGVYGAGVLAVVLTGMGYDGLKGSEQIVAAGGQVLVQDAASSVVWGMPGAIARAGLAGAVLPVEALAEAVVQRTRGGLVLAAES